MLILMTALMAFAGLTYDAGMAFNARREATNIAASAARAGANDIDPDALYDEGLPRLNPTAESTARNAVSAAGATALDVDIDDFEVYVKTELIHETRILKIIGIGNFVVTGEATAMVESRATG